MTEYLPGVQAAYPDPAGPAEVGVAVIDYAYTPTRNDAHTHTRTLTHTCSTTQSQTRRACLAAHAFMRSAGRLRRRCTTSTTHTRRGRRAACSNFSHLTCTSTCCQRRRCALHPRRSQQRRHVGVVRHCCGDFGEGLPGIGAAMPQRRARRPCRARATVQWSCSSRFAPARSAHARESDNVAIPFRNTHLRCPPLVLQFASLRAAGSVGVHLTMSVQNHRAYRSVRFC